MSQNVARFRWKYAGARGSFGVRHGVLYSRVHNCMRPPEFTFLRDETVHRLDGIAISGFIGLFHQARWPADPEVANMLLKGDLKSSVAIGVPSIILTSLADYPMWSAHAKFARQNAIDRRVMVYTPAALKMAVLMAKIWQTKAKISEISQLDKPSVAKLYTAPPDFEHSRS